MKYALVALTLAASLQFTQAQEKLSRDSALRYAEAVNSAAKQIKATPLATEVDVQKPVALRDGDYGGLVLPQKQLTAASLAQASKDSVTPIGQLWLHKLAPMREGQVVSADKLQLVDVRMDGEEATVPACMLGVRRKGDSALELLVFGKDKQPLVAVPLKAIDAKQDLPIDLSAERDYESGRLLVKILGKYEGTIEVTELNL